VARGVRVRQVLTRKKILTEEELNAAMTPRSCSVRSSESASPALHILGGTTMTWPQDWQTNVLFLLRWGHLLAGITWIGLLYFFNLVNVNFM
jgi:hypothetical protein